MDDLTFGLGLRRVRLRRNERQVDVAARAGFKRADAMNIRIPIEGTAKTAETTA